MAILLYIDTAGEKAIVALSRNAELLAFEENTQVNNHASFVQVAIQKLMSQTQIALNSIDAVVVTMGPGSYTGLRVGLASAKGIAYTLNKPLIGISTLALLAQHASNHPIVMQYAPTIQLFSMIDAKRTEVFGAIYQSNQSVIVPEQAIILDIPYLQALLKVGPVICIGNAAPKTMELYKDPMLFFFPTSYTISDFIHLALLKWEAKAFEDIAYSSPAYLKDFYQNTHPKT